MVQVNNKQKQLHKNLLQSQSVLKIWLKTIYHETGQLKHLSHLSLLAP